MVIYFINRGLDCNIKIIIKLKLVVLFVFKRNYRNVLKVFLSKFVDVNIIDDNGVIFLQFVV